MLYQCTCHFFIITIMPSEFNEKTFRRRNLHLRYIPSACDTFPPLAIHSFRLRYIPSAFDTFPPLTTHSLNWRHTPSTDDTLPPLTTHSLHRRLVISNPLIDNLFPIITGSLLCNTFLRSTVHLLWKGVRRRLNPEFYSSYPPIICFR